MPWEDVHENLQELAKLQAQQRTNQLLQQQVRRLPPCPYCGGGVNPHYEICQHCRKPISWSVGVPCKPGNEEAVARAVKNAQHSETFTWMIVWLILGVLLLILGSVLVITGRVGTGEVAFLCLFFGLAFSVFGLIMGIKYIRVRKPT